jgi:hypothetical protein
MIPRFSGETAMSLPAKSYSSANFYRFAAVCAACYVVAQIIQEFAFHHGISDSPVGEQAILQRLMPLDQFRLTLLLLSFFPITVAFAAVALRQVRIRPAASVLGFSFSLLFVIGEIVNRSIDLFVISKHWAMQYQATVSVAAKQLIAERIQVWTESFTGYYFIIRVGLLLGCLCFAIATWDRRRRWNQFIALVFAVNAARSAGRLAEGFMGQAWLAPLNDALYFPASVLIYGSLAVWLWKQAQYLQQEPLGATASSK